MAVRREVKVGEAGAEAEAEVDGLRDSELDGLETVSWKLPYAVGVLNVIALQLSSLIAYWILAILFTSKSGGLPGDSMQTTYRS